ncbi:MAG: terminase large subunit domain-containing protein [Candidatus Heimdallarchaeaceae archaeon]
MEHHKAKLRSDFGTGKYAGNASNRDSKDSKEEVKRNKGDRYIKLDKWQEEVLNAKGHFLLCTGRQVGKTTIFAIKAAERMISQKGCRIIAVSLTEDQAFLMKTMVQDYLEKKYKSYLKVKKEHKPTKNRIILNNGSSYIVRPVGNTGDAVRGFTGDVLIIDEASRMPESVFIASKPTLLTTGGDIWMCSTPFGKKGYFYESWLNKNKRFKVFHISSEKVIQDREISESWSEEKRESAIRMLEEEKKDMSTLQYAQEYLGMFTEDLRQFFPDELIEQVCTGKRNQPFNLAPKFYMGVDIARLGEDKSVFAIVNKIRDNLFHQVENIVTSKKRTTETFDKIVDLEQMWKFKQIGIDAGSGSLGVGVFDFLLREPIIRKKVIDLDNARIMKDSRGEKTGRWFKEASYANMLMLMEKGRVRLLDDDEIKLSLKSVQYEYSIKPGQKSKMIIFGRNHDIVEAIQRALWLANQKTINTQISYI